MERLCYIYVLASRSRNLYVGVTNNLTRRIIEHRSGTISGFTRRYRVYRLVHVETFGDIKAAIGREKQIKSWRREKKVALIQSRNPMWTDLAEQWTAKAGRKADPSLRSG
jgi:putative endonuclease